MIHPIEQVSKEPPIFSIVVPTYNRSDMLALLLKSLQLVRIPDRVTWEILVVNNNSTDATRDVIDGFIREAVLPVRYLFEAQRGAAYARNCGVLAARGGIIAFIDDDEVVNTEWLAAISSAFDQFGCAGVGGRVLARWLGQSPDWYTKEGPYRIVGPIQDHDLGDVPKDYTVNSLLPAGGNIAVRRECFDKYGLFRTDLGPVGTGAYPMGEDTEFCLRLLQGGERMVYVPAAVAFNPVHVSRLTKKFCRSFYFRLGRSIVLLKPPQESTRKIVGVPQHLFRRFAQLAGAWVGSVLRGKGSARLYFGLQLVGVTGQIYQCLYVRYRKQSA